MEEKKQVIREETATGNVVTEKHTSRPAPEEKQAIDEQKSVFRAYYLVYYVTGLIEILLAFQFAFKLFGANASSGFVAFIYSLGDIFMAPFFGIFSPTATSGADTTSIFDPTILVAIAVYALIGWGIAKLLHVVTAGNTPDA